MLAADGVVVAPRNKLRRRLPYTCSHVGGGRGASVLGQRDLRAKNQLEVVEEVVQLLLVGGGNCMALQLPRRKRIAFARCENLLRAPNTRHVAPSRDLVRPGEATRGSRCAGRSALRAQASAHRLARIMSCQFDVRDNLDHQTLVAFESTSIRALCANQSS